MERSDRLRWAELLGLGLAPLAFAFQAFFLSYVLILPNGGGLGAPGSFRSIDGGVNGDIAWVLWICFTFPPTFVQALVLTPLTCLSLLRAGSRRRRLAVFFLTLSALSLALCCVIVAIALR